MKKPAVNPYLPAWEYVPDGEPHIFEGRLYVFGSHDEDGGDDFAWGIMWAGALRWMIWETGAAKG